MISVDNLKFGPDGLIPAVVVDHYTKGFYPSIYCLQSKPTTD